MDNRGMEDILDALLAGVTERLAPFSNRLISTDYFIIFLLINSTEHDRGVLREKANTLLKDEDACAFIQVPSWQPGAPKQLRDTVYGAVEDAVRYASNKYVDVGRDLNTLFLRPVLFASEAEDGRLEQVVAAVQRYLADMGKVGFWQPFVLIQTGLRGQAAAWSCLEAAEKMINALGISFCMRCCLMSDTDERGFAVAPEQILGTVVLLSVLQVAGETAAMVKDATAWDANDPGLFFSAQSVAVGSPVRILALERMRAVLQFLRTRAPVPEKLLPPADTMNDLLRLYLNKMPSAGGRVSLLPLYGVMAGEGLHGRLNWFANRYYYGVVEAGEGRGLMRDFEAAFIGAFFRGGCTPAALSAMILDNTLADLLRRWVAAFPWSVEFKQLPAALESAVSEEHRLCAQALEKNIMGLPALYAGKYTSHEQPHQDALLKACMDTDQQMEALEHALKGKIGDLNKLEVVLDLEPYTAAYGLNGQADQLVSSDLAFDRYDDQHAIEGYGRHVAAYLLQREKNEQHTNVLHENILDCAYRIVSRSNLIPTNYMEEVSKACEDNERAARCVNAISKKLAFPIRLVEGAAGKTCYVLLSHPKNRLGQRLRAQFTQTETQLLSELPLEQDDHMQILRISPAFSKDRLPSRPLHSTQEEGTPG